MVDAAAREKRRKILSPAREVFQNTVPMLYAVGQNLQIYAKIMGRIRHSNIHGMVFVGYMC
jgi:hypothetical protein